MEQSVTKRIAKNVSWLFVGNAISGATNFFLVVYVARVLGVAAFGLWQFAQAFLLYLALLVDSGFSTLGTREIAREKSKAGVISINIFAARLIISIIIFTASLAILYFLPLSINLRSLFVFTFLFLFYRALNADWVFQGLEKMEFISLARVLFSVLSFFLIIFMVKGPSDLLRVPLLQALVGILISIIIFLFLYKRILSVKIGDFIPNRSWQYFLRAIPLCGSVIMMQINNNLDTIMLGFMKGATIVGYYTSAYRIFYIYAGLFSLWIATALPIISKRISKDKIKTEIFLNKYIRLTMWILFPLTVFGFFISNITINLLFGAEYSAAVVALKVLIWTLIPLAIANIYGGLILVGVGHFKNFFLSVFAGAGINIIMNFILIPHFSYIGAAIATITAQTCTALAAFLLSRQALRVPILKYLVGPFAVSIVASIFTLTAYYSLAPVNMLLRQLISYSLFIIICIAFIVLVEYKFLVAFVSEIIRGKEYAKAS